MSVHATWGQVRVRPTAASARARRALLVVLVCAALGALVIVDFPVHASVAYRRSALAGFLATVHQDLASCSAGLHDAVLAYAKAAQGSPAVSAGVPSLFASQAIAVCGFADSGVVNLGEAAPPASVASPIVDRIAPQADAWAYLDAFTLLQDLRRTLSR